MTGGNRYSAGFACSDNGNIIVGASDEGRSGGEGGAPMIWNPGGMRYLGSLGGPLTYGQALACSADGSVVVGISQTKDGFQAFRWTRPTGMGSIGDIEGGPVNARATGVSADGSVIVGYESHFGMNDEAFRWTREEGMVGLGDRRSAALGVSGDGKVIVGMRNQTAAKWTKETGFQDLPGLSGNTSYAYSVSGDGSVIVGLGNYDPYDGTGFAFVWDAKHGTRDLNLLLKYNGVNTNGFYLFAARGVSRDGTTVVGYGFNRQGEQEAFWVRLPVD